MQNSKKEYKNIQHKCIVVISKPKYRINNVFSWITQNVDSKRLTLKSTVADIYNLKKQLVEQNALRLNAFFRSDNSKQGVLVDPFTNCLETPYYVIGDNLSAVNVENRNYVANNLYTNDRIVSCSVTQETDNGWTCSVTLNNTDGIYTLNNEYYYNSSTGLANTNLGSYVLNQNNTCVIEPNDDIMVFMSDWTGKLNSVFTGLVSGVSLNDDGLTKGVTLQCDDMFKKLSWTYKVVKASFDTKEAFGTSLSVYEQNYADMKMSDVIKYLLGEALCDIYKRDSFLLDAVKAYIQNKQGDKNVSLSKRIKEEIDKYIEPEAIPKELVKDGQSTKHLSIRGYKCTVDYKSLSSGIPNAVVGQTVANTQTVAGHTFTTGTKTVGYTEGDLAFKITGMEQPVWAWTLNTGSFDFLFSTFKRNDSFIREIAGITAYEVFADTTGVITFRPPNFTLPRQACYKNKELAAQFNEYMANYIVTQDVEEDWFINFTTTTNDNAVYTQIEVVGSWVENNISHPYIKSKAYAPLQWVNKFGIRMMQPVSRVGVTTADACKKYGELLLWRQNKNYELGAATCILNSNYTVGMPIFINRHVAVWYIKRVTHNFDAGQICTTELTLGYKRVPLCYRKDLNNFLAQRLEQGKLTQTEVDKIKANKDYITWGILDLNYREKAMQNMTVATTSSTTVGAVLGKTKKITQQPDLSKYMLVWEMIPMELYEDIMVWQQQNNGSKDNARRNGKVIKILKTKVKAQEHAINWITPPTTDNGLATTTGTGLGGVTINNSTFKTDEVEKKQQEAMLKTDASYEKDVTLQVSEVMPNATDISASGINALLLQGNNQMMLSPIIGI